MSKKKEKLIPLERDDQADSLCESWRAWRKIGHKMNCIEIQVRLKQAGYEVGADWANSTIAVRRAK